MSTLPSYLTGNLRGLNDLIGRQEKLFDEANEANEQRYQQALDLTATQGVQSKADVRRGVAEEKGAISQGLISRGLGGSTVLESLMNRAEERGQRESTRIDESVADRRAGIIERRHDEGPNLDFISQLIEQLAGGRGQQQRTHTTIGGAPGGGGGKGRGGSSSDGDDAGSGGAAGSGSDVQTHTNEGAGFQTKPGRVESFFNPGGPFGAHLWGRVGTSQGGVPIWAKVG